MSVAAGSRLAEAPRRSAGPTRRPLQGVRVPGRGSSRTLSAACGAIALAQVMVLGVLAARGYWYSDDLDNLAAARGQSLDGTYLSSRLNDHLVPGLRLAYWLFANLAPLDWGVTVAARVLVQLLASVLLARLLFVVFRSGRITALGLLAYATTPLTMPSFMSLSSAVNLLPSHAAGLGLLLCLTRWRDERRWQWLAAVTALMALCLAFWEKSGLVLVSAAVLAVGPLRTRGGTTWPLRRWWPAVAACALPVLVYLASYSRTGGPDSGSWPGVAREVVLVGEALWRVVAPAAVAGPWQWAATQPAAFGLADPPLAASVAGTLALTTLVVAAARRRPRTLLAWALVVLWVAATVVAVSVGRLELFGPVFLSHYHYWSDLSIPLVLSGAWSVQALLDGDGRPSARRRTAVRRLGAAAAAAWLLASTVSHLGFAALWDDNRARPWLTTVLGELEQADGTVNLYDTTVPLDVVHLLAERRHVSDVLSLTDLPVEYDRTDTPLHVLDDTGRLRPADLQVWSRSVPARSDCQYLLQGRSEVTVPLATPLPDGGWFARVDYLSNPDAAVRVHLTDGTARFPLTSARGAWPAGLRSELLQSPPGSRGDRLVVAGDADDVNLCVGNVDVGVPVALP